MTSCLKSKTLQNETQLKISDLRFGDNYKNVIKANNIEKTYMIATGLAAKRLESDTVKHFEFDNNGDLVYERTYNESRRVNYQYDTFGLVKFKNFQTDVHAAYYVYYVFKPNSLVLSQFWEGRTNDTNIYTFNNIGLLTQSFEYSHDDCNCSYQKMHYHYDSLNQIHLKVTETTDHRGPNFVDSTLYFYNNKNLDSTLTRIYTDKRTKYYGSSKMYYNKNGLMTRTTFNDSLILNFIHIKKA